jgi:hypothetical protein
MIGASCSPGETMQCDAELIVPDLTDRHRT